jgi:hypothetical protein
MTPDPYDPKFLSQLAFSRALLGLGAGIASGRNWGESIARGLAGYGVGQEQGTEEGVRLAAYADHQAAAEEKRKLEEAAAKLPVPGSGVFSPGGPRRGVFDAESWKFLPAEKKFDIWGQILTREPKPFTPNLQSYDTGLQHQSGYFDQSGKWVSMGTGPRFAPQQPGADAGVWETMTLPNGVTVQRNKRTGQVQSLPQPAQPQQTSPTDVTGPLLQKMARGETLTPSEQAALDYWRNTDPINQLIRQSMPGGVPETPQTPAAPATPSAATAGADVTRATATATGTDGRKIYLIDGKWVHADGKVVQ